MVKKNKIEWLNLKFITKTKTKINIENNELKFKTSK